MEEPQVFLVSIEGMEALREVNGQIQAVVSERGTELPSDLIQKLSDLDWLVQNNLGSTRRW